MFEEDPMQLYPTEDKCMEMAEQKSIDMVLSYKGFGYIIDSEAHSCQYIDGQTEV
jgi:hypothetical protein|tara:strand:+ start:1452 stop:1616 length:165 start_codon:yes stop_codon:yes gene_type:complete